MSANEDEEKAGTSTEYSQRRNVDDFSWEDEEEDSVLKSTAFKDSKHPLHISNIAEAPQVGSYCTTMRMSLLWQSSSLTFDPCIGSVEVRFLRRLQQPGT